jgi:hypothetical protein
VTDPDSDDQYSQSKSRGQRRQDNAAAYADKTEKRGELTVYKSTWHKFKETYLRPRVTVGGYDNPDYSFKLDGTVLVAAANSTDFQRTNQNINEMGIPDLGHYFVLQADDDSDGEPAQAPAALSMDGALNGVRDYIVLGKGNDGQFDVFVGQLAAFCVAALSNLNAVKTSMNEYRLQKMFDTGTPKERLIIAVTAIKEKANLDKFF